MWTYSNRMLALGAAKWLLSAGIVIGIGGMIGMYITYADLVTPNYWGTAAVYAMLILVVRKVQL